MTKEESWDHQPLRLFLEAEIRGMIETSALVLDRKVL